MTSKISFSKMVLNDSKRRLWLLIILIVGFLLVLPLFGIMYLGELQVRLVSEGVTHESIIENLRYWLRSNAFFVGMGIVTSAVLCAFSGFRYLYKKTKLDVFHSIPLKREKLFLIQYVSGVVIFVIPFIISYLLMISACAMNGMLTKEIATILWQGLGYGLLHFVAYYNVAILAIMLTGKMLVGVLGLIVLIGYMPLLALVVNGLYESFFYTYYAVDFGQRISDWFVYISPSSLHIMQVAELFSGDGLTPSLMRMLFEIGLIVVTFVGSLCLYCKRASEVAERSMAFTKTMPIIKILLMVLISISSGMFFGIFSWVNYDTWFFFGIVVGLILTQGLVAVIYTGDIRKIFSGKKSFGVAVGCVLLIVAIFRFDIFGYDSYRPNPDSVKSVGISIGGLNDVINYHDDLDESNYVFRYVNPTTYRFQHGQLEAIPAIYEIVDAGIRNSKLRNDNLNNYDVLTSISMNSDRVSVCFNLNSGRKVYRSYVVDLDMIEPAIEQIYNLESFKEVEYPILQLEASDIGGIYIKEAFAMDESVRHMQESDYAKILEAYQADLRELTFTDIEADNYIGNLGIELRRHGADKLDGEQYSVRDYYVDILDYPIYKACNRTIEVLRSLGYRLDSHVDVEDVAEIVIYQSGSYDYQERELIINDIEEMRVILACQLTKGSQGFRRSNNLEEQGLEVVFKEGGETYGVKKGEVEIASTNRTYYTIKTENMSDAVKEIFE